MELSAKIAKNMNQIIISKKMPTFGARISTSDAKRLFETGRVTKSNKCFRRLAANDFDIKKTLAWYTEEREPLAKSSTDDR